MTAHRRYARPDGLTDTLPWLVPHPPECPECFRQQVARWLLQMLPPHPVGVVSCGHGSSKGGQE